MERFVLVMVLSLALAAAGAARAQSVTPSDGSFTSRVDLLVGKTLLAGKSLDDLVAALEGGDARQAARAVERLSRLHTQMANELVSAAVLVGEAHTRLDVARSHLVRLRADLERRDSNRAAADLAVLREQALGRLTLLREQYRSACERERPALLSELGLLTDSLESLDDMQALLRKGGMPVVPQAALTGLDRLERSLAAQLAHEERLLAVLAQSLRQQLDALPGQLSACVRLLAAQAVLPREQLAKLRQQRQALRDFSRQLEQARGGVHKTLADEPAAGKSAASAEEVLRKADARLKP